MSQYAGTPIQIGPLGVRARQQDGMWGDWHNPRSEIGSEMMDVYLKRGEVSDPTPTVAQAVAKSMNGPKMLCVDASFEGRGQSYTYFVQPGDEPKVGDIIVTSAQPVPMEAIEEEGEPCPMAVEQVRVATIRRIYSTVQPRATKAYLLLIPAATLLERRKGQQDVARKFREKSEAMRTLKAKFDEAQMLKLYEEMAKDDPSIAILLEQAKWEPGK